MDFFLVLGTHIIENIGKVKFAQYGTFNVWSLIPLFFSTALLCFLLGHEVDLDWTRHVRLLCVLQRPLSAPNSAHMCFGGPHTAAFSVRWTVCATLYQRHVCLWPPPHVWPCDHRWAWAVMATWCFLLRLHSGDALPGGPLSPRCILRGRSCQC